MLCLVQIGPTQQRSSIEVRPIPVLSSMAANLQKRIVCAGDHRLCLFQSCLDGVQEANNVRVIRKELVPWSNGLETEEEEVPNHVLVVVVQPIKTGDHMGHL